MSSTAKIKRQERADRLMNNIPWFRLKMGDIFRSMVMPIAILTFLSIVYGVLDSVQRNITIKNTTISNNITYAKLIFEKLIGFVPMITAISVATTFSSNRTLGAITTFIGWVCFIAIQSVFIKFNGTSYEFLGIKTLKNIIGTNSINRLEIPGLSQSIIYVNSNMIVGFLVGYVNALILSKISKRVSSLTNITFIALVIAVALSMALGVLHSLTIISLTKGLEQSKDIFTGSKLSKNSLNHFLGVLITSAIYPMQLQGLTENLYSPIMNPYYRIILALFVLPLVALVLVNNAKKGNKKFAFSLYLTAIIASVALGQYQPILLTIFFASPLLFLIIGAALPAFASWIIAYVGVGISANPIKSGDLVDFIRNFIIPFIKKDAAYKKAWIILIIGAVAEVVAALIAHFYIKYTKVCVLGKANVVKKMFAYEYITENNYVVFAKYHDKDVRNPIRHQVADEMLNKASLLLEKENIDAANGLSDSAHKMGYTKEVSINSEGEGFEVGGAGKYKVDDQPTALNDLNVDDLFNSPIEKGLLEAPLLDLNIPNQETTTLNNLNVMNEGLEDISDFNEFTSPESPEQYNSIFMPQSFEYTTELTPDVDSPLNIQEATLSQPSFEPINNNVQQIDSTNFDEQNFDVQNLDESMFESSNQPYDLETPMDNLMLESNTNFGETSSDELSEQEIPSDSIDYNFDDLNISEENSDLSDLDNEEEYVLEDENVNNNDEVIAEESLSTKESEEMVEVENEKPIQFMTSEEQHSISSESNDDAETIALKRRIAELEAEKNAIQPTYVETIKFIGDESSDTKPDLDNKQSESTISLENQQENIDNANNNEQISELEKQIAELREQLNNKQQQVQPTYVETIKYLDNPSTQNKQPEYIYNFNEEKTVPVEQSSLVHQEENKEIQPVVKEEYVKYSPQQETYTSAVDDRTVEQLINIMDSRKQANDAILKNMVESQTKNDLLVSSLNTKFDYVDKELNNKISSLELKNKELEDKNKHLEDVVYELSKTVEREINLRKEYESNIEKTIELHLLENNLSTSKPSSDDIILQQKTQEDKEFVLSDNNTQTEKGSLTSDENAILVEENDKNSEQNLEKLEEFDEKSTKDIAKDNFDETYVLDLSNIETISDNNLNIDNQENISSDVESSSVSEEIESENESKDIVEEIKDEQDTNAEQLDESEMIEPSDSNDEYVLEDENNELNIYEDSLTSSNSENLKENSDQPLELANTEIKPDSLELKEEQSFLEGLDNLEDMQEVDENNNELVIENSEPQAVDDEIVDSEKSNKNEKELAEEEVKEEMIKSSETSDTNDEYQLDSLEENNNDFEIAKEDDLVSNEFVESNNEEEILSSNAEKPLMEQKETITSTNKEEHKVINSQDIEKTVEQIVDIIELKNKESKSEFEKTMLMEFASMNEKLSNLIYAMSQQNSGKPVINIINKIDRSLLGPEHTQGIENRNETIYQEVSGQEISTYDESELPNNNQMISYDFEGNQQDLNNYSNDFENQQFDNVNFDNFQFDENGQIEEGFLPVEDNQELNSNVDFGNIDFDSLSFDDSLNLNYIPENNEEKVEESSNNDEQLESLDESQTSDSNEKTNADENIVETSSASEEQNENNNNEFDFSSLDNFEDELTKEMTLEEENGVINNNENISINDESSNGDEQLELLDESQTSDSDEKTNADENIENDNLDISQEFSDLSKDDLINNDELSDEPLELADAETIEAEEELQELDSFDMDEDEANSLANISSGLSFDEEANDEQSLMSEGLTSEENLDVVKQKMFSFETKIKHFMILSPLLGEIISQTPTSIEVLSSSGKLIMPNDAVVEYISENRDKYIVNIYGVKMEVLMNAPLEKTHKQRLHNKIYANEGKKLYKGDFFLDGNKKYYSENGDQMILTFRILPGNYDVYAIRHMNKKLSKWDGIFEISLNKSFDTKSRTAHVVEDDTKEN